MIDRDLLEAAAKAAGLVYRIHVRDHTWWVEVPRPGTQSNRSTDWVIWDPLTDDCDALRLAVQLELEIRPNTRSIIVSCKGAWQEVPRDLDGDYAATRRAIVRAAASMVQDLI